MSSSSDMPPLSLLEGVKSFDLDGSAPSRLSLYGESTFPIVAKDGKVIVAGAQYEAGKVVHFGHEKLLSCVGEKFDTKRLIENIVRWMAGSKQQGLVGQLGLESEGLTDTLRGLNFTVEATNIENFDRYDILVASTYREYTADDLQKIHKFVANGGGLLTGGHNWYSKRKGASDILEPAGIFITTKTADSGVYSFSSEYKASLKNLNVTSAVKALLKHVGGEETLSTEDQRKICAAASAAKDGPALDTQLFRELEEKFLNLPSQTFPQYWSPISIKDDPVKVACTYLVNGLVTRRNVTDIKPHPLGSFFPGPVPSSLTTVKKTVKIDASFTGLPEYFPSHDHAAWRSTGLYAAPGVQVSVTLPRTAVNKGLRLQIGCHTDDLYDADTLWRFPEISRSFDLLDSVNTVANFFGGLLYVIVPAKTDLGTIDVEIEGAFDSPQYLYGRTTSSDWQQCVNAHPVPFCELIGKKFFLTVPTSEAKGIANPAPLMEFYDACVDAMAEVSSITTRPREERFVLDAQISVGYMHAGYPIMGPTSAAGGMLNIDGIKKDGLWGALHELGHQHQTYGWQPDGTSEGTVNIFPVYCHEKLLDIQRDAAHENLAPDERRKRIENFIKSGKDPKEWCMWTCLETYLQLQEAFGWNFYVAMLFQYNQEMDKRPSTNQEIMDEWVRLSSVLTGYNLSGFYQEWGWSISQNILDEVGTLPNWDTHPTLKSSLN